MEAAKQTNPNFFAVMRDAMPDELSGKASPKLSSDATSWKTFWADPAVRRPGDIKNAQAQMPGQLRMKRQRCIGPQACPT
ncbi:hypothetical protein NMQ14_07945 [Methyloversatilis sp. XJ19-13]|uniref:hypothetical protein n=1 Tax=Methyloversatilis sp. XJ19-13 TaxID=2963430 RepID=UPI00211C374C|nr:hypothetical protein [Methyloversatilis sp. XJ19-13]MCQ9374176.1 hypothetical protein [Methyloversatilis sp. XJ19-13]